MPHVQREMRVPYTAAQMFDLVNDIDSYPRFLHWCRAARVERSEGDCVEAVLEVGVGGIRKSFRTRNTLERPRRIDIELLSGPFRRLEGAWTFDDLDDGGSSVRLSLDFEVESSPFAAVFGAIFEELVRSQVTAFIRRAERCYG